MNPRVQGQGKNNELTVKDMNEQSYRKMGWCTSITLFDSSK